MNKLRMETSDISDENVKKIAALFPNCVTETMDEKGIVQRSVKWDVLKEALSGKYDEGGERYEFTWPGKRAAFAEAMRSVRKTLRPCKEESKDWDTTENLYIEGENLTVLKLLQESYLGKVKIIYIDPPYNTGNDFIYPDSFSHTKEEEDQQSGKRNEEQIQMFTDSVLSTMERDENGETRQLILNTETNGHFHSDWCRMIYSRLMLARNLLSEDGAVFISIDDNEVCNLRKICDDVLGDENFVAQLTVIVKAEGRQYGHFAKTHEYVVVYAKTRAKLLLNEIKVKNGSFRYVDERGGFNTIGLRNRAVRIFIVLDTDNRCMVQYAP